MRKRDIVLWMKHSRKQLRSERDDAPCSESSSRKFGRSVYEGHLDKMAQVDEFIDN